jgi:predicted nucleotidyltransferase
MTEKNLKDIIGDKGILLFHYYRGSYAYGTYIEGVSDKDEGAIYICNNDETMGLRELYHEQVSDDKNDKVAYELGRYFELLLKSNPNILEALFVPDKCIIYEHYLFKALRKQRDKFVSQDTIKTLLSYSKSQIEKARGLNKKIVNPITERKTPIDFCFTFNDYQGTTPILNWLEKHNMKQIYCGLNHMPNMNQMYGVFYDYAQHIRMEYKNPDDFVKAYNEYLDDPVLENCKKFPVFNWFDNVLYDYASDNNVMIDDYDSNEVIINAYHTLTPKGYHGIQKESGTSNDIHLDSIKKGDLPICYLSYNENGYESHCRMYKEYKEWEKKRNPVRYESNLKKNFDSKNMCHNVRLLTMAKEMAENKGFIVDRTITGDVDFLLKIRNHEMEYDDIIELSEKLKQDILNAMPTCTLPVHLDKNEINKMLIDFRNVFYKHQQVDILGCVE